MSDTHEVNSNASVQEGSVAEAFRALCVLIKERRAQDLRNWFADAERPKAVKDAVLKASDGKGETLLHKAVRVAADEDVEVARVLLRRRASPNVQTKDKRHTPLHYAAEMGIAAAVQLLLMYKADATLLDSLGRSAERCARQQKHAEVEELLAKAAPKAAAGSGGGGGGGGSGGGAVSGAGPYHQDLLSVSIR